MNLDAGKCSLEEQLYSYEDGRLNTPLCLFSPY